MKPSEHPEYFRLPPPPGRSRESTIVLTRDGRFLHEGQPVEHPGMRRAFASWLKRHPDNGRYILDNGYDWTYLLVEGDAEFVQSVRAVDEMPCAVLLDGNEVPLTAAALHCDPEGVLRLELSGGEHARFTPAAQLELSPWLVEEGGAPGLQIGGRFAPIRGAAPEA
jgi:hypothetical protein